MTGRETQFAEDRPMMPVPRAIYVKVSTEILAEMSGDWSPAVQAKFERQQDDTYELIFRKVDA